jgi:hypothetical protein
MHGKCCWRIIRDGMKITALIRVMVFWVMTLCSDIVGSSVFQGAVRCMFQHCKKDVQLCI